MHFSSASEFRTAHCSCDQSSFPHIRVPLWSDLFSAAWIICSKPTILSLFPTMPPSSHLFTSQPAQPLDPRVFAPPLILQRTLLWPYSAFWDENWNSQGDVLCSPVWIPETQNSLLWWHSDSFYGLIGLGEKRVWAGLRLSGWGIYTCEGGWGGDLGWEGMGHASCQEPGAGSPIPLSSSRAWWLQTILVKVKG